MSQPATRVAGFSDAARRYSTLGWALARADGKRPLGKSWEKAKPVEPGFAAGQWAQWDGRYNIGLVLGPSGLAVVEFDTDQAGAKLLELLDGELPVTPIAQSGSGRLHLYFRADNHVHATRDGLELRAGAHFMVLPPSVHPNGATYTWLLEPELPPADVPRAVLDYLAAPRRTGPAPPAAVLIPDGQRNTTLTSLAGTMRRRGMGEAAILAALRETPCEPALPESELAAIARSVGNYTPAERPTTAVTQIEWQQLSEIEMRSIVFLDKPLLQADAFHLVAGRKGQGKGTVLADIAGRVTRGELGSKNTVIWIGSEDSNAIDVKPRIVAAGGNPERIWVVKQGWVQLPRDIGEISRAMDAIGDVGMVILDPVSNHITGKDDNSSTDIRDAISPLNELADKHACMVFGIRHLSEKECSRGVLAAILGSSAWVQVPRAVIAVARDTEDPEITHIQCVSGNRLPPGTSGRMFRIEGVLLEGLENEVTRAAWLGDSNKNVETMLGGHAKEPPKSVAARDLILDILEAEGEQESDMLDARVAEETGLAARTARNVRMELGREGLVKASPDKDEYGTVTRWKVARSHAPRS